MNARTSIITGLGFFFAASMAAMAGEATTSATAGSTGRGAGTAAATANYDGNGIGFTKTKANSGTLNFARGLSVGFDEDGLSLSHSYALAPNNGPAIGGTFNMHLGLDGETTVSTGKVEATGDRERSVAVNGSAGSHRGEPVSIAGASGRTGPRGEVRATTESHTSRRPTAERRIVRAPVARRARVR